MSENSIRASSTTVLFPFQAAIYSNMQPEWIPHWGGAGHDSGRAGPGPGEPTVFGTPRHHIVYATCHDDSCELTISYSTETNASRALSTFMN